MAKQVCRAVSTAMGLMSIMRWCEGRLARCNVLYRVTVATAVPGPISKQVSGGGGRDGFEVVVVVGLKCC